MRDIEVFIGKDASSKYRVISKGLTIVDIPGIDDSEHAPQIKQYLKLNKAIIIPVLLLCLTNGEVKDIV